MPVWLTRSNDMMPTEIRTQHPVFYFWAAFASLLVVVYLTLLPFEFRDLTLADAWRQYLAMDRGAVSDRDRQQWMANALMFMPLGFFLTAWWTVYVRSWVARLLVALLVCLFCLSLTAAVELGQVWMPNRRASLNDIAANFSGGVVGVLAALIAVSFPRLLNPLQWKGAHLQARHFLTLYVLGYVVVSLLPFDFLLSLQELRTRWQSDHWSWWRLADACSDTALRCLVLDLAKFILAVPLGLWVVQRTARARVGLALPLAMAIALALEAAQFLLVSGRADGYAGLLRAAGAASGVMLGCIPTRFDLRQLRSRWGKVLASALIGPYVLIVIALAVGDRRFHWDFPLAWEQLRSLRLLPFYYHYFVSEATAIRSLLLTVLLYAPVGGLVWLGVGNGQGKPSSPHHASLWRSQVFVFGVGVLTALAVEAAKLFAEGLRPDPTNVWLGGLAAWGCLRLLDGLTGSVQSSGSAKPPAERPRRNPVALLASGVLTGCAALAALRHPIAPDVAMLAVLIYGALILRWPSLWLVLVPASLPVLDFTPWTGRLYFDEWDLLVVTTLAALWLRAFLTPAIPPMSVLPSPGGRSIRGAGRFWLGLFLLSYGAAVLIALWPPIWPDNLELASLHSPYNALRLAKGPLWALLLWPFFRAGDRETAFRLFALGMVLGLAAAVSSVLWERYLFTGLFDFSTAYRTVGMFSGTHTGGAFVEAYLVTAAPFLAMSLVWRRGWWPVALLLFLLACYAVAVTFARAAYASLLVALLITALAAVWRFGANPGARLTAVAALLLAGAGGIAVLDRVQQGEFMSERVEMPRILKDFEIRVGHWRQSLEPVLADGRAIWTGLGVGRFPEVHFWKSVASGQDVPAIYTLTDDTGPALLNLMPGPLYLWQAVTLTPGATYRLRVKGRAGGEGGRLTAQLCEKWLLYSRRCQRQAMDFEPDGLQWVEASLTAPARRAHRLVQRPTKLILYNASRLDYLTVASVSLLDPGGRELLVNGDFSHGMDRWFFTSDDHLAWHLKNLWVQVFFEQGLIGLVSWTMLVLTALLSLIRKMRPGGTEAWSFAVLLASLSGFLAVGLFDSLFDTPRLATLFFVLVLLALAARPPAGTRAGGRPAADARPERRYPGP